MIVYTVNTTLAAFLTYSFYKTKDGLLRVIMYCFWGSVTLYQFVMLLINTFEDLEHGTWYSSTVRFLPTLCMLALVIYMYKDRIIYLYYKCLNFLTQLRKTIQKLL